jgi:predicted dithiol-disulfide oxidoreductase (DUF899 family)
MGKKFLSTDQQEEIGILGRNEAAGPWWHRHDEYDKHE